jgi:hypothetical protein
MTFSLKQLKKLCDTEPSIFTDEQIKAVNTYWNQSTEKWCINHFYLYGQTKVHIDTLITDMLIKQVKLSSEKKIKEYGTPFNSNEAYSIYNSQCTFNHFISAIDFLK